MGIYRRTPFDVRAVQYAGDCDRPAWFVDAVDTGKIRPMADHASVFTSKGLMYAGTGYWITWRFGDVLDVFTDDEFKANFEPVDGDV